MGLYKKYILPKIIHWTCQQNPTMRQREKVVPLASGKVLEIGIGSGLNLSYYNSDEVQHLTGIDPSAENWNMNTNKVQDLGFDFEFIKAFAEDIPSDNNQYDSAIITYALCSIPEPDLALEEIKRVLKPNGKLIFCEHGLAPDTKIKKQQKFINPMWRWISGGCNLTRDVPILLANAGFKVLEMDTMYLPGWKPGSFNYWGSAKIE